MSKKINSKLLSIVLCIAICCATLCGSVIAARAAAADFNGTYTITVGDDKNAVPFGANEVKAKVRFDLPAGFVGGQFTAEAKFDKEGNPIYTIGDTATVVDITTKDGSSFDLANVKIKKANNSDKFRFVIGDGSTLCTSITVEYTLKLNAYVNSGNTTKYNVSIALDDDDLAMFSTYADMTASFSPSAESDSWFHTHSSWYHTKDITLDAEKNGKHTIVTNARCHWCTTKIVDGGLELDVNDNYIAQVLPDYTEFDGVTTPVTPDNNQDGDSITAWIGISGVTVRYNDNGALDVDVHVYSQWRSGNNDKIVVLICDTEGNELYRLSPVANGTSYFAGNGFPAEEKKFTITGLSAKNLDTQLLLTAVEYSNAEIEHSRTMPFCLADYCENVVEGESTVWADGATAAQIEADKDVAAALYYYGASIEENVFDKNSNVGGGSSAPAIEYINTNYDEWDGTKAEPTQTDSNGNIIIETAEHLAWIALDYQNNTADKTYIVKPNSVFNMMGREGINVNSTAANVKNAAATGTYWYESNFNNSTTTNYGFEGVFDGNGLIVYNINTSSGAYSGLFPIVYNNNAVIKNVTVTASSFTGFHGNGGIVGSANGNTYLLTIEGCSVKNSCFAYAGSGAGNKAAGVFAGYLTHMGLTIENCHALNNVFDAGSDTQNLKNYGGLFGHSSAFGKPLTFKNTVFIGTSPVPVGPQSENNGANKLQNATWNNVYSNVATSADAYDNAKNGISVVDKTGNGAVASMNLDYSKWIDTTSYPELSIFHKTGLVSVDETTHKIICLHKTNGVICNLSLGTKEHTLIPNGEGTAKVCECGYSEEIIGNSVVPNNKTIAYWNGGYNANRPATLEASGMKGTGDIADPYIVETPAQLWYVAQKSGNDSAGMYYKVSDSVAVFDLSGDSSGWNLGDNNLRFQGNFDGNGVEIRNFYSGPSERLPYHCALFPNVTGNVTISNIKIVNGTIKASSGTAGGIIANVNGTANIKISNCAIIDSTVTSLGTGDSPVGAIVGHGGNGAYLTINNCFVSGSTITTNATSASYPSNCVLGVSWTPANCTISNSIILGCNPESRFGSISNVYSDYATVTNANITKVTNINTIKGAGAVVSMKLDSSIWFDTASYPELKVFHDMQTIYVDENTHKTVCGVFENDVQCTVCGFAVEHDMILNAAGTAKECACGISEEVIGTTLKPVNKKSVVWDGKTKTALTDADKDENGVYIIKTAEQLAWLALGGGGASSDGNTYKISDDIGAIYINGGTDDLTLSQVKNKLNGNNTNAWGFNSWVNKDTYGFSGTFDGNGATIYGLYFAFSTDAGAGAYNGGLFPYANGDVTIKNVTVKNSYVEGWYVSGALIGNWTAAGGNVTFDKCVVTNCYVANRSTGHGWAANSGSGFCGGGEAPSKYTINKCAVYDNEFYSSESEMCSAFVSTYGITQTLAYSVKDSIAVGYTPFPASSAAGYYATLPASIPSMFNNVYTSLDMSGKGWNGVDFPDGYIITKSVADMQGIGAVETMNLGADWFDTNGYPELHVFHDMATITIDEQTHQYVCQIFIDGEQCSVCQAASAHEFVDNQEGTKTECDCGYGYELKGIHAMDIPQNILNRITNNSVYTEKFASNALFKTKYNADVYSTQTITDEFDMYTTSLNLKVNPHIGFMFAFHGDYKTNRSNITVKFTVDGQEYTTAPVETGGVLGANWVNSKNAGRYHLYRFKELPVSKLCKDIAVTVNYKGTSYDFGTYSVAGYAINAMNAGDEYQEHVNAAMALVYYSEMLAARAAAK